MKRLLVNRRNLCDPCSLRKGVKSIDAMLRAAILLARLRQASPNSHELRIRYAIQVRKIVDSFIAEEVRTANSLPEDDPSHMSWTKVGQAVELSRSAAYARYGAKCDK